MRRGCASHSFSLMESQRPQSAGGSRTISSGYGKRSLHGTAFPSQGFLVTTQDLALSLGRKTRPAVVRVAVTTDAYDATWNATKGAGATAASPFSPAAAGSGRQRPASAVARSTGGQVMVAQQEAAAASGRRQRLTMKAPTFLPEHMAQEQQRETGAAAAARRQAMRPQTAGARRSTAGAAGSSGRGGAAAPHFHVQQAGGSELMPASSPIKIDLGKLAPAAAVKYGATLSSSSAALNVHTAKQGACVWGRQKEIGRAHV